MNYRIFKVAFGIVILLTVVTVAAEATVLFAIARFVWHAVSK